MKRILLLGLLALPVSLTAAEAKNPKPAEPPTRGDRMLADYFRAETDALSERCLADIQTLDDWKARRDEYRRQLQEMLGLWPMPERTDLKPVITGKLEHDQFTVEKLHFQASPGLYVTANLFLPKKMEKAAPAILYVCGHSKVVKDGVSFGNKAAYQHHGAWFARNGYVCLVLDTLQLGELEGIHHGTHRYGMWWWNSRGYAPAGVEAWFGIRALDYLCTRPEVDTNRFGITGRSGGGSYSWTIAALDERIKVAAPVAGITDLQNQVVDGCVEGHCDCMFFLNTYRWDFPQVAALIAPRPLLICNSDKDGIFPLDGVVRLHQKTRRIYELYGAKDKLGLLITEGPHADTQDLQVPVFRWFNRFLKGEQPLIEMAAKSFFQPEQLKVFDKPPADARNTNAHDFFVPKAKPLDVAESAPEWKEHRKALLATLKEKSFAGWPTEDLPASVQPAFSAERENLRLRAWDVLSQYDVPLRLYVVERASNKATEPVVLSVLDEADWRRWLAAMRVGFENELTEELAGERSNKPAPDSAGFAELENKVQESQAAVAFFAPRGVGLTAWTTNATKQTQIRRRFMLLGQTLDGMRVWDIRRAIQALHFVREAQTARLQLRASRGMGVNALYAALFEPGVQRLEVNELPASHVDGPDYLSVLKVLDIPQALELAARSAQVSVDGKRASAPGPKAAEDRRSPGR
jgi:dienelactone hydrolase